MRNSVQSPALEGANDLELIMVGTSMILMHVARQPNVDREFKLAALAVATRLGQRCEEMAKARTEKPVPPQPTVVRTTCSCEYSTHSHPDAPPDRVSPFCSVHGNRV